MEDLLIGKVNIDLSKYPGEDIYTEGAIEDRLLKVSENNSPSSFRKIVEETSEWSYLYHLSPIRQNIVSWLPIKKTDKVLEVGAGMGAITGELCKLASSVDAVDLSLKRSKINANRNREYDNLLIKVGNFTDIEPNLDTDYDWIMLIGVFEYSISYMQSDHPFEDFLKILKKHVKSDGRIVIAIENRLGMKYFAGCMEDHTSGFFDGIENYAKGGQARTFSRKGFEKLFNKVDITDYHFYYPYPDYKLPHTVFSDKRLPLPGECKDNIRNFDRDRLLLFNEENAYDGIIEDGDFPTFSNSYEVIIGPDVEVDYAKFSEERADKYCILTTIVNSKEQNNKLTKQVNKTAIFESGKEHIANIKKAHDELSKRYWASELIINRVLNYDPEAGSITFEYVDGRTLEELMDEKVKNNDKQGYITLFEKYKNVVGYNTEHQIEDTDMIFSNILVNSDGWHLIDYEWCNFTTQNVNNTIARAIANYLLGPAYRAVVKEWINEEYAFDEDSFQKNILGDNVGMPDIRHNIGKGVYNLDYLLDRVAAMNIKVQVYEDYGDGFREETSYYMVNIKKHGPNIVLNLPIKEDVKNLRVDPGDNPIRLYVNQVKLNDKDVTNSVLGLTKNGCIDIRSCIQRNNVFTFRKDDPHIKFPLKNLGAKPGDTLTIDCRVENIL
ncbi:MAG: methyltransferase domain-containing protein [Lachnospiraceae bacterium]|nr:methyltransferase domain-containing protein [Lachnospiraceae bacterium]